MMQWRAGRFLSGWVLAALMLLPYCSEPMAAQAQTVTAENPWTNLWQQIVRRRDQEPPRTSRGLICPIVPQLIEQRVMWRDQPIFVWKDQVERVSVSVYPATQAPVWQRTGLGNVQSVVYSGPLLQPGQQYLWKAQRGSKLTQVIFEILDQPARAQITAELTQLEARLRRQQATPEARIQQRVQFFLDKNLFLDAIQELHTAPHPSPALKKLQQQIGQLSCPDPAPENSDRGLR